MSFLTTWPEERYAATAFDDFNVTPQLDLGTARGLMWLSQLAYEADFLTRAISTAKIESILQRWQLKLAKLISVPVSPAVPLVSRDALVVEGRGAIMLAFAGTDPARLQDWFTDFDQALGPTCVATGFGTAASAVVPEFAEFVRTRNSPKIFAIGHSLGGAIAAGFACDLRRQNICDVEAVYTYGMPRAGNMTFAADYEQRLGARTFRFVHGDDVVPMVPPANLLGRGYQHVGRLIHCARGAKFARAPNSASTSNEPDRSAADIAASFLETSTFVKRGLVAFDVLFRGGRPLDSAIELLPPRVRQHLQDQYIVALT